ncbi:MAG: site-specific integrase [Candidatus Levybacteria bacterium]|nr:site-specific integrase [Candidatus Levybacteria bacterium]
MEFIVQFRDYLFSQQTPPSKLTVKNYSADIKKFINWYEHTFETSFTPSLITPEIINIFNKELSNTQSINSVLRYLSSLRKFFSFLTIQKNIQINPFEVSIKGNGRDSDKFNFRNFKNYLYTNGSSSITIKNYLNDIKQFLLWADKVTEAKEAWIVKKDNIYEKLNSSLVEEYKTRLIQSNFSPSSVNRKLSSIRKYLSWCHEAGLINTPKEELESISPIDLKKPLRSNISDQKADLIRPEPLYASYSKIPPVRVGQKIIRVFDKVFDYTLVNPIISAMDETQYLIWRFKKKPIFASVSIFTKKGRLIEKPDINLGPQVTNINKAFYAPISIKYLTLHKKLSHYVLHKRPKWYKAYHSFPISHYLHFALLIIFTSALGFGLYQSLFRNTLDRKQFAKAESPFNQTKVLSFRQKLTDSLGNPVTLPTNLRFALYNDHKASGSALLWEELDQVRPNENGEYTISLGEKNEIPQSIFMQNSSLWLGITIEDKDELIPRQQIANTALSSDAKSIEGLKLITNSGKEPLDSNAILALDSSGNLSIGGEIPHIIQAVNSKLSLSGNILYLSTIFGSNSDVQLSPDGLGKIDLQKPLQNSTNNNNLSDVPGAVEVDDLFAILATSSAQSALTINQNDLGPLISASASRIAKFTVDNSGNTTIAGDLFLSGLSSEITTTNDTGLFLSSKGKGGLTLQSFSSGNINFFSTANTFSSEGDLEISGSLRVYDSSVESSFAGNVAVGTNDPSYRLDVQEAQAATAAARIYNSSTSNDASGLIIRLGNNSVNTQTSNKWVNFEQDGMGTVGMIRGNGSTGIQYQTNGIADFAEYLRKDENQKIDYGEILCLDEKGFATPCKQNERIVGVASRNPSFLGGENLGEKSIPVGLVGIVSTKVSSINGPINEGDLLTSSEIPGYAMKATKEGMVVGRALQSFNPASCLNVQAPSDNFGLIENSNCKGEILLLLGIGYQNPNPFPIQAIDETLSAAQFLAQAVVENLEAGIIKAREISTDSLTVATNSVFINGQSLKDYVKDIIAENLSNEIISPVVKTDRLYANIISPLSKDSNLVIKLASGSAGQNTALVIKNSQNQDVATINSNGDASISGKLTAQDVEAKNLNSDNASISGILRVNKIIADQIESLEAKFASEESDLQPNDSGRTTLSQINPKDLSEILNLATFSAQLAYIDELKASTAYFEQGFISLGPSSLSNVSIVGELSVDSNLILANRSINVLGSDLELQPLRQGGISLLSGLVYIDTEGNLKVSGNAEFAKDLKVRGTISANIIAPIPDQDLVFALKSSENYNSPSFQIRNSSNSAVLSVNELGDIISSGSGTFSKLNFSLVQPALAISETQALATGSAGIATIKSGQKEITIFNKSITDKSLIYITPTVDTYNLVLYLIRQVPNVSFTVGINTPLYKDIPFNWFILN